MFNQLLRCEQRGVTNGENRWRISFLFLTLEDFMTPVPPEILLTCVVRNRGGLGAVPALVF